MALECLESSAPMSVSLEYTHSLSILSIVVIGKFHPNAVSEAVHLLVGFGIVPHSLNGTSPFEDAKRFVLANCNSIGAREEQST